MKRHILGMPALILVLLCVGCQEENKQKVAEVPKDDRVAVEKASVGRGTIEAVVTSSANLEAEATVKIYSRAANHVAKLLVEEGDRVEAGQLLVQLESQNQEVALARAEASLEKTRREHKRKERLIQEKLITEQDFNNSTHELKVAELAFKDAEREMTYTEIRATISGTITKRDVKVGDFVNINQELFEIVDFDSIVARVYLPEKVLPKLKQGLEARVTSEALGKDAITGRIERISPVVDSNTGTVKVTVAVDDTRILRPGMYVDVSVVLDKRNDIIVLPKRALVYDADQIFVFRINRSGERIVAERVLVKTSLSNESFVEPVSGFNQGDEIVVAGHTGLKDGAPVRVLGEVDPEADRYKKSGSQEDGTEVAAR